MSIPERVNKSIFPVVTVLIIVSLCVALDNSLTESPIVKDARQNLQAAYNVCTWGVFSTDPGTLKKPSIRHYREPLPPFASAFFLQYYKRQAAHLTDRDFEKGEYARLIKRVNIVWAFFVLLGSAVLAVIATRNRVLAILAVVLVYACFLRNPAYIDGLLSEIPTAALLLWTSIVFIFCIRLRRPVLFLAAGILLGFLTLTKAIFLYAALVICAGVVMYILFLIVAKCPLRLKPACLAFFVLGLTLTSGPWLLRNKVHFDSFAISSRGGLVLHYRALKNHLNMYEVCAAFHRWGPGVYQRAVKNTFLDVRDSDYEEGGRAARLNRSGSSSFAARDRQAEADGRPERVIALYRRARAQRVKMTVEFQKKGLLRPDQEADNFLKQQSLGMIIRQPVKHVLMTIPFAWRGIWCFYGGGIFTLLNAISYGTLMALCCYGAVTKNRELLLFCLLPVLMLFLYAFFTHNESRFSSPAIPFMVISFFIVVSCAINRIKTLAKRGSS